MIPWLWLWCPQFHYPWSGSVAQRIEPNWFYATIPPTAGDAGIEQRAVEVASYGRQLGLITELLLDASPEPNTPEAKKALERLREIHTEIEKIKSACALSRAREIEAQLEQLKARDPDEFKRLAERLRSILFEGDVPA